MWNAVSSLHFTSVTVSNLKFRFVILVVNRAILTVLFCFQFCHMSFLEINALEEFANIQSMWSLFASVVLSYHTNRVRLRVLYV